MLCLRCLRGGSQSVRPGILAAAEKQALTGPRTIYRTFSAFPTHRPSILPSSPLALARLSPPTTPGTLLPSAFPSTTTSATTTLDLLPKPTSHPGLAAQQIRCGPRNTLDPSHRVRKRRHGFLARRKSRTGMAILRRRRAKGRSTLSH
ncbi:MAG: hypothetical protein M1819_002744 [Sarea resinae]|nr:MAG: hypothetical protein M1819_002744 [Sarea resinae]